MKGYRILVVEDEVDICEILQFNLENEGFVVDVANSAEEALNLKLDFYNLFLLDIMMGKMSGFKLAQAIRKEKGILAPVIFLTAKNTENDTLTGFSLGADDYIAKPFSVREVIARVKAVLKRTGQSEKKDDNIVVEGLMVDLNKKEVTIDKRVVALTKKEFDIVQLLLENKDKLFSRTQIIDYIWGDDVVVSDRTIDVHIARLRKKLGKYGKAFVNRSGYGYCFDLDKLN
ncbi:response regulator transcription factor [Marinilabiliaceae bacterium ANBcel2]|nr:response regulator transcription factor [Marinilabiliaceae bacterium ANBcel2]